MVRIRIKYIFITILLLLMMMFVVSCKKDSAIVNKVNTVNINLANHDIKYTDIPDTLLRSILYINAGVPVLKNSLVDYYGDIDGDGVKDFAFSSYPYSYSIQINQGGPFITITDYLCGIIPLQLGDSNFVYQNGSITYSYNVKLSDEINTKSIGGYANLGSIISGGAYNSQSFTGDRYVGFKKMINGKAHFGWIRLSKDQGYWVNTILIKDFAINLTPGNSILTGQKE